jgi:hypothetical protein
MASRGDSQQFNALSCRFTDYLGKTRMFIEISLGH